MGCLPSTCLILRPTLQYTCVYHSRGSWNETNHPFAVRFGGDIEPGYSGFIVSRNDVIVDSDVVRYIFLMHVSLNSLSVIQLQVDRWLDHVEPIGGKGWNGSVSIADLWLLLPLEVAASIAMGSCMVSIDMANCKCWYLVNTVPPARITSLCSLYTTMSLSN